MLCKVTNYDKGKHIAKVQPLAKTSDKKLRSPIPEVIVPSSIWQLDKAMKIIETKIAVNWQPMKYGSVVNVAFFDRDIEKYSGKSPFELASKRMHSMTDGIIESVVIP